MNEHSTQHWQEHTAQEQDYSLDAVSHTLLQQNSIVQDYMKNPEFMIAIAEWQRDPKRYGFYLRRRKQGFFPDRTPSNFELQIAAPLLQFSYALDENNPLQLRFPKAGKAIFDQPRFEKMPGLRSNEIPHSQEQAETESIPPDLQQLLIDHSKMYPAASLTWKLPLEPQIDDFEVPNIEEILESLEQQRVVFSRQMQAFLQNMFGYNQELSVFSAQKIHTKLENIQQLVQNVAHWSKILAEAQDELLALAPNVAPTLNDIASRIILYKSNKESPFSSSAHASGNRLQQTIIELTHHYGTASAETEGAIGIFPPPESDETGAGKDIVDKVSILHELAHIIFSQLFIKQNTVEADVTSTSQEEANCGATLIGVLHEAVAVTFELSFVKKMLASINITSEEREALSKWHTLRRSYLVESLKLWQVRARQAFLGEEECNSKPSEMGMLMYAEGASLANHLARKGWTLNDLPDLVAKVRVILAKEAGEANLDKLHKIPVEKRSKSSKADEADTAYSRIIKSITSLSPSAAKK